MNILRISGLVLTIFLLLKAGALAGELSQTAGELDAQAMIELNSNHLPEALRLEQQAVQAAPDDPQLHIHLSNIWQKSGEITNAISEARKAVAQDERDWQLRRRLAELLQSNGCDSEAATEWQKAFSLAPRQLSVAMPLATCLKAQGRSREAMLVLEQIVGEHKDNDTAWLALANEYLALGDKYAAKLAATQTVNIAPTSKDALRLRSDLSTEVNSQENAIQQSKQCLLDQPRNAIAYSRVCHAVCGGRGDLTEAAWVARKALSNRAGDTDTLLELGRHFLEQAASTAPDRIGGNARLQKCWWRLAEALLRKTLDTQPDCFEATLKIAQILLAEGRGDEALPFAAKACSLQPDNREAKSALKRCLAYQNDLAFQLKKLFWLAQ